MLFTYDLESVGNDADSHELLSVVAAVHHDRVGETLDDGALGLAEALGGVTASGVREVDGRTDLDVVAIRICMSARAHIDANSPMPMFRDSAALPSIHHSRPK